MMQKYYNSKALGKYLGEKVCVGNLDGQVTLVGVSSKTEFVQLEYAGGTVQEQPAYIIYPILKTVEDLTEEEADRFNAAFDVFEAYTATKSVSYDIFGAYHLVKILSKLDMYCEPSKSSPTGYKSLLDGLPCKRWEKEMFK